MKLRPHLFTTLPVFLLALGLTAVWRLQSDRHREDTALAVAAKPGRVRPTASASATLLTEVRRLLRAGDFEGVKAVMATAAEKDPKSFFKVLRTLPYFAGLDEIVRHAAATLPWQDAEAISLLDGIGPSAWRGPAWEAYIAAQVGRRPDEEILRVALRAHSVDSGNPFAALFRDAAEKRPAEFAALLDRLGSTGIRSGFYAQMMRYHPEQVSDIYRSTLQPGVIGSRSDLAEIRYSRLTMAPTAENLATVLSDAGLSGRAGGEIAVEATRQVYIIATPEERRKMLDLLDSQSAAARNRTLDGILEYYADEPSTLSFADTNQLLSRMSSGQLQESALKHWIESQHDPDPADRSWINQLPTARLRTLAATLLDERSAAKR